MKTRHSVRNLIAISVLSVVLTSCSSATTQILSSQDGRSKNPIPSQTNNFALSPEAYPYPITTPIKYPTIENSPVVKPTGYGPTLIPVSTLSPEEIATDTQYLIDRSKITLKSNSQTVIINNGVRFFVFLDDEKYPIKSLRCEPEPLFGAISNGFFRGPNRYPAYFEATRVGTCILRNGDFAVTIFVVEPTPRSPSATPLPTYTFPYP